MRDGQLNWLLISSFLCTVAINTCLMAVIVWSKFKGRKWNGWLLVVFLLSPALLFVSCWINVCNCLSGSWFAVFLLLYRNSRCQPTHQTLSPNSICLFWPFMACLLILCRVLVFQVRPALFGNGCDSTASPVLWYERCVEVANHYLGFDGWSSSILKVRDIVCLCVCSYIHPCNILLLLCDLVLSKFCLFVVSLVMLVNLYRWKRWWVTQRRDIDVLSSCTSEFLMSTVLELVTVP